MTRTFHQSYHIPGTLAANVTPLFKAPADMTLLSVSAVASNDSAATLAIGLASAATSFMAAKEIGDSNVPVEFGRADFVGGQYPRIRKGDLVLFTLDFDGASGTAAQNVTLVATFAAG